jgi:hypothetical protein
MRWKNRAEAGAMKRCLLMLMISACATPALAGQIDLSSTKKNIHNWQVSEVSDGNVISAPARFVHRTIFGGLAAFSFPFSRKNGYPQNDGYWYADIGFTLPANTASATLKISALGVDDRAVVELNGTIVTDAGLFGPGAGFMTYTDGGTNETRTFANGNGVQNVKIHQGLVTGANDLRIIINNTGDGIYGAPIPKKDGNPTVVGIVAVVKYTTN